MKEEYVDLLISEFLRRKGENSNYSERAFARLTGLSAGFLKLLFQRRKRLSLKRAEVISERLGWDQERKSLFLKRVKFARMPSSTEFLQKIYLEKSEFFEISDWYHFAIVELIKTQKKNISEIEMATSLGISALELKFALRSLIRLGLIEEIEDGLLAVPESYEVPSVSADGIKKYHKQLLKKAIRAIDEQSFDHRDFRGATLAFDLDRTAEARIYLEKFVARFDRKFGVKKGNLNSVYQLSTSFFRIDKENK